MPTSNEVINQQDIQRFTCKTCQKFVSDKNYLIQQGWTGVNAMAARQDWCYCHGSKAGLMLLPWQQSWTGVNAMAARLDWCYCHGSKAGLVLLPWQQYWTGVTAMAARLDWCYCHGSKTGLVLLPWQ